MKKLLAILLTSCMILLSLPVFSLTAFAENTNASITVTDVNSLNNAIKNIADGGTIIVDGTIVAPAGNNYTFNSGANKSYTVTGGAFDFTALTSGDNNRGFLHVKDNVTFESTKFIFDSVNNDYIFANGYKLTIAETVVFEGAKVCFYGGVLNGDCKSVDFTLLSGNYTTVNSTSNSKRTISGDVNCHIGGNVTVNDLLGNSGGCTRGLWLHKGG